MLFRNIQIRFVLNSILLPENFLLTAKKWPIFDVRSPSEFAHAHIPNAINIPLFDDTERAEIGTIYKQIGRKEAILRGLDHVGPKLSTLVTKAEQAAPEREVLIHCWRGGMRSSSFAWLLQTAGFRVYTLEGGYKAYRKYILGVFDQNLPIYLLAGETGSGKTDILHALRAKGEAIIDLEALANHKGSSFGALGQQNQPGIEQFENNLAKALLHVRNAPRVWIESESRKIGRVVIPEGLWLQMQKANIIQINVPLEFRIKRLIRDYGNYPQHDLEASLSRLRKHLGGLNMTKAIEALQQKDLETTVRIAIQYYDKTYKYTQNQRLGRNIQTVLCRDDDAQQNAHLILKSAFGS